MDSSLNTAIMSASIGHTNSGGAVSRSQVVSVADVALFGRPIAQYGWSVSGKEARAAR
jgi:hypothetical protein